MIQIIKGSTFVITVHLFVKVRFRTSTRQTSPELVKFTKIGAPRQKPTAKKEERPPVLVEAIPLFCYLRKFCANSFQGKQSSTGLNRQPF